jgi:hypothetical protein
MILLYLAWACWKNISVGKEKKRPSIFFLDSYQMQPDNHTSIPDKIDAAIKTLLDKPSEEIREQLISLINELINTDFNALIQLLYRIDVDEKKLKNLLKEKKDTDAALLIADLIISRQLQKIATKKSTIGNEESGPGDKW